MTILAKVKHVYYAQVKVKQIQCGVKVNTVMAIVGKVISWVLNIYCGKGNS
jgi:hypothetical protein